MWRQDSAVFVKPYIKQVNTAVQLVDNTSLNFETTFSLTWSKISVPQFRVGYSSDLLPVYVK